VIYGQGVQELQRVSGLASVSFLMQGGYSKAALMWVVKIEVIYQDDQWYCEKDWFLPCLLVGKTWYHNLQFTYEYSNTHFESTSYTHFLALEAVRQ
jgi:hypothetical protein